MLPLALAAVLNVRYMLSRGVPVLGFTWYSLTDQMDWDVALRDERNMVNPVGLYDLDRRPRPVAAAYRQIIREFSRVRLGTKIENGTAAPFHFLFLFIEFKVLRFNTYRLLFHFGGGFSSKVMPSSGLQPATTMSWALTSPLRRRLLRGVSSSRWIARRSGLAPNVRS